MKTCVWFCGILILCSAPLAAQEVAPSGLYPQFEAKRIRPPSAGSGKRITVQIQPSDPITTQLDRADDRVEGRSSARALDFAWFWDAVDDDLQAASPGRLMEAMILVEKQSELPVPRLQDLQDLIQNYGVALLTSTIGTEVSPALALAVLSVESAGHVDAVSAAGAQGLMQLMPATAERFSVTDAFDPGENIAGGVRYLDWLMGEFAGDPLLVLAGYNAGAGAVREHNGVPPYPETRAYVPKVLAAYRMIRNLCQTPPILISDGCVFQNMR